MKVVRKNNFLWLFYLFLTGCVVGWVYEVLLGFIYGHGFVNRGFLYGPYLPLYGFGLIILYILLGRLSAKPLKDGGLKYPILVFLGIVVITTFLEYIVGYGMLQMLHQRWWDYSSYWMNYQGIISFNTSLRFGIGGMFLLYGLVPLADKIFNRISLKKRQAVMVTVLGVMIIDLTATLLNR